jgi:hypothetical protein
MSYSYYPYQPINNTIMPEYINESVIQNIYNDPQVNQFIINQDGGEYIIGYHKIVYYINYQIKEFVISIVPLNTTESYKIFTCDYTNDTSNSNSKYITYDNNSDGDTMMIGNTTNEFNLDTLSTKIRFIQQNIFEQTLLPGHGVKTDWTFTLISKDTGNNAALDFIFKYYYSSIKPEQVGGIQRYKIQNTGYKYFQQLGFGNLLDKMIKNQNLLRPQRNLIGKNIFMTLSQTNDLLNLAYKDLVGNQEIVVRISNIDRISYFLDKWHRNIVYTEQMNKINDDNQYKCNKYYQYVKSDGKTLDLSSITDQTCGSQRTIKREYFGLPNYFYRYSRWNLTGDYLPTYSGPFIQYNNTTYNICTAD